MKIERLDYSNVGILLDALRELAKHHNEVSVYFSGNYPHYSYDYTLKSMAQKIKDGISVIEVISIDNQLAGFSQCTIEKAIGTLEYLIIFPKYRNHGYGKLLMDRSMGHFDKNHVNIINVKVVHGNDCAKRFYERYGFKQMSDILSVVK